LHYAFRASFEEFMTVRTFMTILSAGIGRFAGLAALVGHSPAHRTELNMPVKMQAAVLSGSTHLF
jgi:hypothetical protein